MSSSVQQLIEAGYVRSTANDPGKLSSDQELIAYLNRCYQTLYAIMAVSIKDAANTFVTLTFAGSPATASIPTEAIDLERLETLAGENAYLIPVDEKDRGWHIPPSVYRKGNLLVSRGLTGDPVGGTQLRLHYKDNPAQLTALNDTLDARFPFRYENILVLDLALYLSIKDEGRSPQEFQALKTEYTEAMAAFSALTGHSNTTKESAKESVA